MKTEQKKTTTFAERLTELRNERGLSQDALSAELGVSKNSIYHYENEKRVPDAYTVIRLARYFGVTTDYLLGLDDMRTHVDTKVRALLEDKEVRIQRYRALLCDLYDAAGGLLNAD